jgi:hypothetical protein
MDEDQTEGRPITAVVSDEMVGGKVMHRFQA